MRRLIAALLLVATLFSTGCQIELPDPVQPTESVQVEYPAVNLPYLLRQKNWLGNHGEGSCVHASMISLLRWQGQYELANWWRNNHGNGEWDTDLARKFDRKGIKYAYTSRKGDVRFLEWACRTRRGAGVSVMGGRHMVALVHFDDKWAGILDNNSTHKIRWVPRKTFVAEWVNSTSWAVTPMVGSPAAPLPAK